MRSAICTACATIGTLFAAAVGGWDHAIVTLCSFMAIDYVTGLVVAAVFHASQKSESGAVNSRAAFKGLLKKCMILLLVVVANLLDQQIGASYIRDGVCIAFMVNEVISIMENASLMGLPIPKVITNALDILKAKQEGK